MGLRFVRGCFLALMLLSPPAVADEPPLAGTTAAPASTATAPASAEAAPAGTTAAPAGAEAMPASTAPAPAGAEVAPTDTTAAPVSAAMPASTALAPAGASAAPAKVCNAPVSLRGKMHQAIYAALRYPAQTAYYAATGVTAIEYDFADGHASNVRIATTSGDKLLDRVAVAAVKNAKYPAPDPDSGHRTIHDMVYIIFDNTGRLQRNSNGRLTDGSQDKGGAMTADPSCADD
jgi:periplasmic protein TonB